MFDYNTSIMNPALKWIVAGGYAIIVYLYYRCLTEYRGSETGVALKFLLWMGIFGLLASLARIFGDGIDFGFTKEYSLRWFQSLFYVFQAVFFIFSANYFLRASR